MFMGRFAGLYAENLARLFDRLGGRTYLLTQTSQDSRLEVIIIDLETTPTTTGRATMCRTQTNWYRRTLTATLL